MDQHRSVAARCCKHALRYIYEPHCQASTVASPVLTGIVLVPGPCWFSATWQSMGTSEWQRVEEEMGGLGGSTEDGREWTAGILGERRKVGLVELCSTGSRASMDNFSSLHRDTFLAPSQELLQK